MKWFAWYPVCLKDGSYVWLKRVCREWNWELNSWGDSSGYSGTDGGWEYFTNIEKETNE